MSKITVDRTVLEQARINDLEAACGGRCNAEYNLCAARVEADKLKKETR